MNQTHCKNCCFDIRRDIPEFITDQEVMSIFRMSDTSQLSYAITEEDFFPKPIRTFGDNSLWVRSEILSYIQGCVDEREDLYGEDFAVDWILS